MTALAHSKLFRRVLAQKTTFRAFQTSTNLKSNRLDGRVSVVTGGSVGIGRAVCFRLAQEGSAVVIADINKADGEQLANQIRQAGGQAMFQLTDTRDETQVAELMESCVSEFGHLDVLVNNATKFQFGHLGPPSSGTLTDFNPTHDQWIQCLEVNVIGYANAMKYATAQMMKNSLRCQSFDNTTDDLKSVIQAKERGSIVNIASVSSYIAQPEFVPYNASKSAILSMTKCAALDFAQHNIRVNSICPGTIETPASHRHMELCGMTIEEGRKAFGDTCAMKRQAAPQEIASVVSFLASDDASFMTGSAVVVDGGATFR